MRIAYANAFYRTRKSDGGNVHVHQFIRLATRMGHEIWTWPGDEHPEAHHLSANRWARILQLRRMDAIYMRVDFSPPGPSHWAIPPYRQIIGSPVVVWEFNQIPEFGKVLGWSPEAIKGAIAGFQRYGRGCDLAICVSDKMAEYVRDHLGIASVLVVPNGSDPDLFRPDVPPVPHIQRGEGQTHALWMGSGNLRSHHNLDLLKAAAWHLWELDDHLDVQFHVIGVIPLGLMREMPPNVHYHGPEEYEALPGWLAAMDIGLCVYDPGPADFGSPLKLFDYMASGLAVVATEHPQIRQVFQQMDQTDLLVPHGDAEALASAIIRLARDRDRIRRLGEQGRKLVCDHYNWERAVRDAISAIEALQTQSRRAPSAQQAAPTAARRGG